MKTETNKPLTRQQVLEEALRLIDEEGLEACSMRKLGARLGVEAMSLYNHVENKQAIFDGVIELLIMQAPLPAPPSVSAREALWDFAHGFRDLLRAHPRVLPLVAASPLRTPASLVMLDHLLATMGRARITGVQAIYTLQCLVGFVIGHTLIGQGMPPMADTERGPNGPSVWRQFPAGQFPTLHALLPTIAQWNPEQEFEYGLQALFQSWFGEER